MWLVGRSKSTVKFLYICKNLKNEKMSKKVISFQQYFFVEFQVALKLHTNFNNIWQKK